MIQCFAKIIIAINVTNTCS